jgi:hypothetical protein
MSDLGQSPGPRTDHGPMDDSGFSLRQPAVGRRIPYIVWFFFAPFSPFEKRAAGDTTEGGLEQEEVWHWTGIKAQLLAVLQEPLVVVPAVAGWIIGSFLLVVPVVVVLVLNLLGRFLPTWFSANEFVLVAVFVFVPLGVSVVLPLVVLNWVLRQGLKDRYPTEAEQEQITALVRKGIECLGLVVDLPKDLDDCTEVVRTIRAFLDEVRGGGGLPELYRDTPGFACAAVGALWGDLVRRSFGWEWVYFDDSWGFDTWGVVSPDRAYICFPHLVLAHKLAQPESDNTMMLLFKMIRDGDLPRSSPGRYMQLH